MYGHLYSPHLLSSEITTERYSVLVVFPAGILGYMPKSRADFFLICNNTYRVQRVFVFNQTLCLSFGLNTNTWDSPCNRKRPTQKIPMANKQASGETAAMCNSTQSTHKAHILPPYCEGAQAVSSSTGRYLSLCLVPGTAAQTAHLSVLTCV